MAEVMSCPGQNLLEQLLEGLLPDDVAVELEHHLLACQHCCQTVRELRSTVRQADLGASARAAAELSDEQAVVEVAQRVATLRLPDRSGANAETIAGDSETTGESLDFRDVLDPPQSPDEIGRFGGYRVLRAIGAGGMGLVWEAEDPQLRRRVALKVMKPALANQREHRERFLREARAAAAIDHSHIVTVYQVGEHGGLPFLAMQLLHGETLDDLLRREKHLSQAECLRIGRQMAEALGVAHRRGLIHRDVKPANTWLEEDGGWVKLVDFGLAQAVEDDAHLTQTGMILGTPAFMSPEQARGEAVDLRSDLFSLGAVLYRMTTGAGPFQGPSTLAVLTSLALRNPDPPQQVNADISPECSDLIVRLLAKDPADRPASAEAVVRAIRAIEEKSSKSKVQSPKLEVAGAEPKRCPGGDGTGRRRRLWPLIAAAAAAFLLAGIVVVVRDKDGNILGKFVFRDGHSAEVTPTDTAAKSADTSDVKSVVTSPTVVPEPPPLDEWLEGRQILTVSQDGHGQFKTIQAALDALKPGQVVEVLDRGPYRETLLARQPKDSGLISRAGTVIEPGEKRPACFDGDTADFNYFGGVQGFRLSGLSFVADELKQLGIATYWVHCTLNGDLLVENCRFSSERPPTQELMIVWNASAPSGTVCHVRECLFETAPFINTSERPTRPVAIIERNWFRRTSMCLHGPGQNTVIRHNVFEGTQSNAFTLFEDDGIERLEIYNNTLRTWTLAWQKQSATGVTICNNIFREPMLFGGEGGLESLAVAKRGWQVDHNEYAIAPEQADQFPMSPADYAGEPKYLSRDPKHSDYLRIASDSVEAHRGTGGELPGYLGALPPGPAPKDGDWLTRWIDVAPTLRGEETTADRPSTVIEPPSLDDWLKGRKVLTVSQDGRGAFKTIQAALDAVQPGQAVEVLDRGPYRELLFLSDRKDVGLISRAGAVIASGGTRARKPIGEDDTGDFHYVIDVGGFRLSGISFVARADDLRRMRAGAPWFVLGAAGDVVIENCHFEGGRPGEPEVHLYYPRALPGAVLTVRECLLDAAINVSWAVGDMRPVAVIERNWFRAVPQRLALQIQGPGQAVVVRHNVFDGHDKIAIDLFETGGTSRTEIYNNTVLAAVEFTADPARSHLFMPTNVVVRNNLFQEGIGSHAGPNASLAAAKGWHVGHNEYGEAPERADQFPKTEADFAGEPKYLSRDPKHSDYLRIASDGDEARRGAGGDWPGYLGALPPGPAPQEGDWLTRWIAK